jgi:hypothetical protein
MGFCSSQKLNQNSKLNNSEAKPKTNYLTVPTTTPAAPTAANGNVKPQSAEFYTDLLSKEYQALRHHDSESDDTASSVSTVIEVRGNNGLFGAAGGQQSHQHLPLSRRDSTASTTSTTAASFADDMSDYDGPSSPLTLDQALDSFERLEEQCCLKNGGAPPTNSQVFDVMAAAMMDDVGLWPPKKVSATSLRRGNSALASAGRPQHLLLASPQPQQQSFQNGGGGGGGGGEGSVGYKRRTPNAPPPSASLKMRAHLHANGGGHGDDWDDPGFRRRSMDDQQLSR